jgi:hypothetical protein
MHAFLEHLRGEYGSAGEYIQSTGASEETVERVRAALRGG